MISRPRLIFVVFYLTSILIATVYIRNASSRVFYTFRRTLVSQNRLKQQLRQKQIEFESMINPAAISQRLKPAGAQ
jgi:hypothetical protein